MPHARTRALARSRRMRRVPTLIARANKLGNGGDDIARES